MHTGPLPNSAGTFSPPDERLYECIKCKKETAKRETWESNDGAYTDERYTCTDKNCGHVRWVDGIDS